MRIWLKMPQCHPTDFQVFPFTSFHPESQWNVREGYKRCWYCGSLECYELLQILKDNKVAESSGGSDWKYGWPHKFYVDIVSGKPDETFYEIGERRVSQEEWKAFNKRREIEYKAARIENRQVDSKFAVSIGTGRKEGTGNIFGKFYTEHLSDVVEEIEIFIELAKQIEKRFGIRFEWRENKLFYSAPYYGYQV